MATAGKRKPANQLYYDVIDEDTPELFVKSKAFTTICKPLNGSIGKTSYMLKLEPLYVPKTRGLEKIEVRQITGLRGVLRHSVLKVCHKHGLEVCHSTDRLTDKDGNNILCQGFHPLGWCDAKIRQSDMRVLREKGENAAEKAKIEKDLETLVQSFRSVNKHCIVQEIFGSKHHTSPISVFVRPIISANNLTQKALKAVEDYGGQFVYVATENRNVMTFDGKPIQNFSEVFFSGSFEFEINVTQLKPHQLGLVLNGLRIINKLGRGYNAGYGHLTIQESEVVKRKTECQEEWDKKGVKFTYDITETAQPKKHQAALRAWQAYREKYGRKA